MCNKKLNTSYSERLNLKIYKCTFIRSSTLRLSVEQFLESGPLVVS